ncbi:hypothetical protein L9F63_004915 [Diploptera punctata]|uniref:TNase-like domain-containing protein n=1 Tax=Diploptera punctata TaxID=6984 RepID=A0AAD7ZE63_DIPPU|nr:hypothetical protein L9F63_004915 [Diploptera punctata]
MDDERHWMEKFSLCLERNIRGFQYGVYGVAFLGLAVALRSVRPFKKFITPNEIPASFIEKHITLNGKVVRIETSLGSSSPLLLVDHQPILASKWRQTTNKCLPVQVSSVDVLNNGVSWLQHIVAGSHIKFTLLKVDPHCVSCIVSSAVTRRDVGVDLVSLGFASVSTIDFDMEKDPMYMKYYKQLLAAENRAEKKGVGMWAPNEVSWFARQWRRLWEKISLAHLWSSIRQKAVMSRSIKMVKF